MGVVVDADGMAMALVISSPALRGVAAGDAIIT
jgi:hypothetical protein